MRPITSVAWGTNRIDLFGLGLNNASQHQFWNGSSWSPNWEALGGVFASALTGVSRGPNLLDIFGLGTDYQMYHQSFNGSAWSGWEALGGVFTSSPAVVSMGPNRLDVFGLGTDHALYHRFWDGKNWSAGWERLGGSFTSQPEVVTSNGNRLDVFAVGSDFAMHHLAWTPAGWTPWESLGGVFISQPTVVAWKSDGKLTTQTVPKGQSAAPAVSSEQTMVTVMGLGTTGALFVKTVQAGSSFPSDWDTLGGVFVETPVAVSWGQDRIDVFGIGTDRAMYHQWFSGTWSGGWESLGGVFSSPPAVCSWSANRLDVSGLGTDYAMYHRAWDGTAWSNGWEAHGGRFALPGTFRFSLDSFEIDNTRSVHNDTDYVSVTIQVGARPPQTLTKSMGDVNNGTHNVELALTPINIDLSEFVIFNYVILNNGHSNQQTIDDLLTKAANALATKGAQAAAGAVGAGLGTLVGADLGSAVVPILGTALGAAAGWLLGELTGIVFANCDGVVAVEQAALTGVQLRQATMNGTLEKMTTTHPGTNSPTGCGSNSIYKTTWSYQPVDHA